MSVLFNTINKQFSESSVLFSESINTLSKFSAYVMLAAENKCLIIKTPQATSISLSR